MKHTKSIERFLKIKELRDKGFRLAEIGREFGVTRQRVYQILKNGVPKKERLILDNIKSLEGQPKWRKQGREKVRWMVRDRDNFTCQECGKKTDINKPGYRSLDVHHLNGLCGKKSQGYDKIEEMDNLITLCHKCHYNRHDFSKRLSGEWESYQQ